MWHLVVLGWLHRQHGLCRSCCNMLDRLPADAVPILPFSKVDLEQTMCVLVTLRRELQPRKGPSKIEDLLRHSHQHSPNGLSEMTPFGLYSTSVIGRVNLVPTSYIVICSSHCIFVNTHSPCHYLYSRAPDCKSTVSTSSPSTAINDRLKASRVVELIRTSRSCALIS
jgi:hypothetical protein